MSKSINSNYTVESKPRIFEILDEKEMKKIKKLLKPMWLLIMK